MKSSRALLGAILFPALFLFIVVLNFTLFAQNEDSTDLSPFERYLALIPAPSESDLIVSYADYAAFEETRVGAAIIDSRAAFEALNANESEESLAQEGLWMASMSITSGPAFMQYLFPAEDVVSVMGLDLFAVDQALVSGMPPSALYIMSGDWDAQAVIDAHLTRGYTEEESDAYLLLCPPNGCGSGLEADLSARDINNLFGGDIGRQWPILVTDDWIISSSSDEILADVVAAGTDEHESVLDLSPVQAAVHHLNALDGRLRQAQIFATSMVGVYEDRALLARPQENAPLPETDYPIAPYALLVLSDHVTETQEIARALLVFESESDAQQAVESIVGRLAADMSLFYNRPYQTIFIEDRGVQVETDIYPDADTGHTIAEIRFINPVPPSTPSDDFPAFVQSAMTFRLLMQMFNTRDLSWLAPNAP